MVKTRLIPILYILNGFIVRSEGFTVHQNIGNVINQAQRYNEWNVDELIYIDITRQGSYNLRRDDHRIESYSDIQEIISRIGAVCFMPVRTRKMLGEHPVFRCIDILHLVAWQTHHH